MSGGGTTARVHGSRENLPILLRRFARDTGLTTPARQAQALRPAAVTPHGSETPHRVSVRLTLGVGRVVTYGVCRALSVQPKPAGVLTILEKIGCLLRGRMQTGLYS